MKLHWVKTNDNSSEKRDSIRSHTSEQKRQLILVILVIYKVCRTTILGLGFWNLHEKLSNKYVLKTLEQNVLPLKTHFLADSG